MIPAMLTETINWEATIRSEVFLSSHLLDEDCAPSDVCGGEETTRFVLKNWCAEAMEILESKKETVSVVVGFVGRFVKLYCLKAWLVRSAYREKIEVAGLVGNDMLISGLSHCMSFLLSSKVPHVESV
ncbi:hypothetical protein G9A89_003306 [Geosiphon pyriformis]|nr:hypothetical protein G9A89_003306 [Geosiphon pyriformis]